MRRVRQENKTTAVHALSLDFVCLHVLALTMSASKVFAAYIAQYQATCAVAHAPKLDAPTTEELLAASLGAADANERKPPATPADLMDRIERHLAS